MSTKYRLLNFLVILFNYNKKEKIYIYMERKANEII
jgi:hypothetical protein